MTLTLDFNRYNGLSTFCRMQKQSKDMRSSLYNVNIFCTVQCNHRLWNPESEPICKSQQNITLIFTWVELLEPRYCSDMCLLAYLNHTQDHLVVVTGVADQYNSTPYHLLHLPKTDCLAKIAPIVKTLSICFSCIDKMSL